MIKLIRTNGAALKKIGVLALAGLIFILAVGCIAINVASTDIWSDEACTLATVENNFQGITYATAIDVHPPLYYYIVKLFYNIFHMNGMDISRRIILGRVISLLPLIIIFVICIVVGIRRDKGKCLLIYPFLLCQYRSVIGFSCEIRMYSWALLFVTIVGAVILYMEDKEAYNPKCQWREICAWGILVCATLCVCYTHYFAVLPVVVMWIVLGASHIKDKKYIYKFLGAGICVVIGYIPWLIVFMKQFHKVHGDYWIPETSAEEIRLIEKQFLSYDGRIVLLFHVMLLIFIFYFVYRIAAHRDVNKYGLVMTFMPYVLILISVGIAKIYRPILVYRYIIPALGIASMGELLFLQKMFRENKMFIKIAASFFCIGAIVLTALNLTEWMKDEKLWGNDWDKMIEAVSKNDGNTFLYIENGQPMVKVLTVMFSDSEHICENANMSEYNQFLFDMQNYEYQDFDAPFFIITASDNSMEVNVFTECLGTYRTCNGEYTIYFQGGK